jgi:PAS domain S-box-containing protein
VVRSRIASAVRPTAALPEAGDSLEAFVHAAPLAIIVVDRGGVVRHWNRWTERLLGWRAAETVGRPNPAGSAGAACREGLAADVIVARRTRWRRKDGARLDLRLSCAPVRDRGGAVASMVIFLEPAPRPAVRGGARR